MHYRILQFIVDVKPIFVFYDDVCTITESTFPISYTNKNLVKMMAAILERYYFFASYGLFQNYKMLRCVCAVLVCH